MRGKAYSAPCVGADAWVGNKLGLASSLQHHAAQGSMVRKQACCASGCVRQEKVRRAHGCKQPMGLPTPVARGTTCGPARPCCSGCTASLSIATHGLGMRGTHITTALHTHTRTHTHTHTHTRTRTHPHPHPHPHTTPRHRAAQHVTAAHRTASPQPSSPPYLCLIASHPLQLVQPIDQQDGAALEGAEDAHLLL